MKIKYNSAHPNCPQVSFSFTEQADGYLAVVRALIEAVASQNPDTIDAHTNEQVLYLASKMLELEE